MFEFLLSFPFSLRSCRVSILVCSFPVTSQHFQSTLDVYNAQFCTISNSIYLKQLNPVCSSVCPYIHHFERVILQSLIAQQKTVDKNICPLLAGLVIIIFVHSYFRVLNLSSFLKISCQVFKFLSTPFKFKSLKFLAYSNLTLFVIGVMSSCFVPILIILVCPSFIFSPDSSPQSSKIFFISCRFFSSLQ